MAAVGRSEWPDISDAATCWPRLEAGLRPYLGNSPAAGAFANLDLAAILAALLPWPLPRHTGGQAPTH